MTYFNISHKSNTHRMVIQQCNLCLSRDVFFGIFCGDANTNKTRRGSYKKKRVRAHTKTIIYILLEVRAHTHLDWFNPLSHLQDLIKGFQHRCACDNEIDYKLSSRMAPRFDKSPYYGTESTWGVAGIVYSASHVIFPSPMDLNKTHIGFDKIVY